MERSLGINFAVIALPLAGRNSLTPQPGSAAGNSLSTFGLGKDHAARQLAAQRAADDAKCRECGFKPGTETYGNCHLKLEEIRATERAALEVQWAVIEARRGRLSAKDTVASARIQPGLSSTTFINATSDRTVYCTVLSGMRQTYF